MNFKKIFFAVAFVCSFSIFADETPEDLDAKSLMEMEKSLDIKSELQRELLVTMPAQNFNLDPHTANYSSEAQILDSLYEGLYSYDPKSLEPKSALAVECKLSRDKKKLTYKIRANAKFSDGSPINAFSVRNAWIKLLSTKNAPYASLLDCVKGVENFRNGKCTESEVGITARNDETLVVYLEKPTAHFNKIICHHAFSVKPDKKDVYSGAFVLSQRNEKFIVLTKNNNYWDAENVKLPSIRIDISDDIIENTWTFNLGKTDWIVSSFDSRKILNKNSVRLSAIFGTEYIFFSCKNAPWNRADFRNALISAVPWKELRKNSLVSASTLVYPLSGYPKVEGLTETEFEDALDMIKAAKKAAGMKENEKLKIVFGISATSERHKRFVEILKSAWKPLGVEVESQSAVDFRYIEKMSSWNADIFVYSWIGDFADPLAFLELFRENSTLNQSKWVNQKFTELLEKSCETTDNEEHYKILAEAEQTLLDDGVIMPVSHSISLHSINPNMIGGWYTNALDIHPYKYIYFKQYSDTIPNVVMR